MPIQWRTVDKCHNHESGLWCQSSTTLTGYGTNFTPLLAGKMPNGVLAYVTTWSAVVCSWFIHHKVSGLYIFKMVWPRITKLYATIHANVDHNHTACDTSTATSGRHLSRFEKKPNILPQTASSWILVEWHFVWPNQLVGFLLLNSHSRLHQGSITASQHYGKHSKSKIFNKNEGIDFLAPMAQHGRNGTCGQFDWYFASVLQNNCWSLVVSGHL